MATQVKIASWEDRTRTEQLMLAPMGCCGCGDDLESDELDYSVWSTSFLSIRDYCSKACMEQDIKIFKRARDEGPDYFDDLVQRMNDVKEYGRSSVYNARTSVFYRYN